jgi:hypothetical protein
VSTYFTQPEADAFYTNTPDHLSEAARRTLSIWRLRRTVLDYRQGQASEEELASSVRAFFLSMQNYPRRQQF